MALELRFRPKGRDSSLKGFGLLGWDMAFMAKIWASAQGWKVGAAADKRVKKRDIGNEQNSLELSSSADAPGK